MKYIGMAIASIVVLFAVYVLISGIWMILAHNISGIEYWQHDVVHMIEWLKV